MCRMREGAIKPFYRAIRLGMANGGTEGLNTRRLPKLLHDLPHETGSLISSN